MAVVIVLALVSGACGDPTTEDASTSTASAAARTTTTPTSFPGSPYPSEEALLGLRGLLYASVLQPDLTGLDPLAIQGDPVPLLESVDAGSLMEEVGAIAHERGRHALDALVETGDRISRRLDAAGYDVEEIPAEEVDADVPLVVARSSGTDCPGRVVAVGAHYDADEGSPGANSNASGVASLLELARLFADQPLPMSLEFVALPFGAEGPASARQLLGVDRAEEAAPSAFISLDRVGVAMPDQYLLMISDERSEYLARVFAVANARFLPGFWAWGSVIDPDEEPDTYTSDHVPFQEEGVATLLVTDTRERRHDWVGPERDRPEILDRDFLANSTRAVIAGLVGLGTIDSDADGVPDVCTRDL